MKDNVILEVDARREVYNSILKHPGIHLRELIRKIDASEGTVRHHIKQLKKNKRIIEELDGRYSRFYVLKDFKEKNTKIIHALRKKTQRNILLFLSVNFYGSQIQISKELNKSPKTIEYHLKKLVKEGLIEKAPTKDGMVFTKLKNPKKLNFNSQGRQILYRLKDPYGIYEMIINYREDIFEENAQGIENYFHNLVDNFFESKDKNKSLDKIISLIYENKFKKLNK